jgi:hypothetical protein
MTVHVLALLALLAAAGAVHADEDVQAPVLRPGDAWVIGGSEEIERLHEKREWKVRREIVKVEQGVAKYKFENVPPSSPRSGESDLDVAAQVLLNRVVSGKCENTKFPLVVGKDWTYDCEIWPSSAPTRIKMTAKVVGWEEVTVPAGTYRALRIEHRGRWIRQLDFSKVGRFGEIQSLYEMTVWYSPAAKAIAKRDTIILSAYGGVWSKAEEYLVEATVSRD